MPEQCIVIGASAGGIEPLREIASQLPAELPVPVFVVLHVAAYQPSYLPEILSMAGPLTAVHPQDNTEVKPGFIYAAPPDHHLLIDGDHMAVERGPKENGFRPSIDALFRSAAYSFGPGAIGVVLSGSLNDGTSGLWSIKRLGGIAIIQDPDQAKFESMPRSVLEYIEADYRLPSSEIGTLLVRLAYEQRDREVIMGNDTENDIKRMATELQVAAGINISEQSILDLGSLTPFTCPECKGVLTKITEGKLSRFRCHTGHGYSEDALLEEMMKVVGDLVWQVTRGFQEAEMVLMHIGQYIQDVGDTTKAEKFFAKARELSKRASSFQAVAINHESLSTEILKQEQSINSLQKTATDD